MGVWIEISLLTPMAADIRVTPFMGVWIEITKSAYPYLCICCHSLYGSVD